ncbi:MAG: hypothetical protein AAGE94_19270 [Acidobacteriota bacterium]
MHSRILRRWRIFFAAAGLLGLGGGIAGFLGGQPVPGHELPAPLYPYLLDLLFAVVIIFGIGYLMVAADPLRHRGIVVLGVLSKVAGAAATWWAVADGQIPSAAMVQPWIVDVPWAIGFAWFLWQTRPSG